MSVPPKLAVDVFDPDGPDTGDAAAWGSWLERIIIALVAEQTGLTLPNLLIRYTVTGGTADNIIATANLPVPSGPGLALFSIQIAQDNTGPVTINGKRWLTNVGNEFVAGGIKAGGIYLFLDNGSEYRAITDQDVSALVAEAEAQANRAQNIADTVAALSAGPGYISIVEPPFGATLDPSQTPSERRAAIQAAIDYGALNGVRVFFPAGTWIVDDTLFWHSNSHIEGFARGVTIVKLSDDALDGPNVLEPSARDGTVNVWSISHMTIDGNASRAAISGVGALRRPGNSCISTASASHGVIDTVECKHGVLHGIDVCNGGETEEGTEYYVAPANAAADYYPDNMSRFVRIVNANCWDAGDDNITTHYSQYVWVIDSYCHDSGFRHGTAAAPYGIEFDDGSLDCWAINCFVERANVAFGAKGHSPEPGASRVYFTNISAQECNCLLFVGSTTAVGRDIEVNGAIFRNPKDMVGQETEETRECNILRIERAERVSIKGLRAYGIPGDEDLYRGIWMFTEAKDVVIDDFHIEDWGDYASSDGDAATIRMSASAGPVTLSNGKMVNCAWRAIYQTGSAAPPVHMSDITIEGNDKAGSIAVELDTDPKAVGGRIRGLTISGYATHTDFSFTRGSGAASFEPGGLSLGGAVATGGATLDSGFNRLELPETNTIGNDILRIGGGSNVARFYETGSGALGSSAGTALRIAANNSTSRSINAAGTINASGADYAEYHQVKPHLYGLVSKGAILGYAADGLLTDRFVDVVGRFVIKSTNPYGVGGDDWGTEERLCALYDLVPVDEEDEGYTEYRAALTGAMEDERVKRDRIAKAGYVPVNIAAAEADIGKYLVPVDDGSGGITAILMSEANLTLAQYIRSIGSVIAVDEDGRPLVEVKVG